MQGQEKNLHAILEPGVNALGYELLGVKFFSDSRPALLRLYIDHENGIDLDDCAKVSRQVSGTLEVEDSITQRYNLEVSSPGSDRPIFSIDQFERYCGQDVKLRMQMPIDGQRKFHGRLIGVSESDVSILFDGVEQNLPLEQIATARLVPEVL